jgi:hypothetical protein
MKAYREDNDDVRRFKREVCTGRVGQPLILKLIQFNSIQFNSIKIIQFNSIPFG